MTDETNDWPADSGVDGGDASSFDADSVDGGSVDAGSADAGSGDAGTGDGGVTGGGVRFSSIFLWFQVFIPDHKVDGPPGYGCFLGDDRSFSTDPNVFSRLHAQVHLQGLGTAAAAMADQHVWCDETRQVDCDTETPIAQAHAQPSGGFGNFSVGGYADPVAGVHDTANSSVATLSLDVTASDPLVGFAPTVGAELFITVDPVAGTVDVNGMIDHWPAFEGYASADGGSTVIIFQIDPPAGSDAYSLLLSRDVSVHETVTVV